MFNFGRKKSGAEVEVKELMNRSNTAVTSPALMEKGRRRPWNLRTMSTGLSARSNHHEHSRPLKRYYLRGILAILCPVIITIYWYIVWFVYLIPENPGSPILFGHRGAIYVFYSWFLIGIFGLGIGEYALVGIEASMLMEKRWAAKNAMQVMMHADHSWAGPSGWCKVVIDMFIRGKRKPEAPTPLWMLLAFLSFLPFVALPLTGLCMELKDGFHPTNDRPLVAGLDWSNFNLLSASGVGADIWKSGFKADLPQLGVLYTAEGVDRASIDYLKGFPNQLPNNTAGIKDVFITTQAAVPMVGKSWGLMLSYDCTTIAKLSDFTILNKRQPNPTKEPIKYWADDTNSAYINVRNSTIGGHARYANNYWGMLEEGVALDQTYRTSTDGADVSDDCYFWAHNNTAEYPGMDKVTVYESLLWQYILVLEDTSLADNDTTKIPYDVSLNGTIPELLGAYTMVWEMNDNGTTDSPSQMSAIGARCTVSSAVGTASIDGTRSTYKNFTRGDTPIEDSSTCAPRMDVSAPSGVIDQAVMNINGSDWVNNLFRSVNYASSYTVPIPKSLQQEYSTNLTTLPPAVTLQLSYLKPEHLRDSLLKTYPAYVDEIMYNGGMGFSDRTGVHGIYFQHPNTTAYQARKLFETGTINLWIPGAMLIVWAFGTIVLAIVYGFRRRWAVELDGYSMFRFGSDFSELVRERPEFGVNMKFEECYLLKEIPGMVGDVRAGGDGEVEPGKITLVERGTEFLAEKGKEYM